MIQQGLAMVLLGGFAYVKQAPTEFEKKLLSIAHQAVESEVNGKPYVPEGNDPPKAVFVTIEKKGVIRGCRGDLLPRTRTLEEEVALAAKDAASRDPRYRPLQQREVDECLITVTIVDRQASILNINDLTPEEGLVLRGGGRTGVVLPWEGRDPKTRLSWAFKKAGVTPGSSVSLSRLIATRFRG